MIVDQAPDGIEVLRGASTYTFDGNWKLQAENGADGYHVSAVHWNYAATTSRRSADGKVDNVKAMNAGAWAQAGRRLVLVQERPHAAVDQLVESRGPAAVCQARGVGREVRRGEGRLDAAQVAQPVPLPQRVSDGPVQLADPRRAADLGQQERGDDLLHRAQGRAAGGARSAGCASTRTSSTPPAWRRPTTWKSSAPASRATKRAPSSGTTCAAASVHWVEGPDENANLIGLQARAERRQDRGRRPVHDAAQVLARDDEEGAISPNKPTEGS